MPTMFAFGVSTKAPVRLAVSRPRATDSKASDVTVTSSTRVARPIEFDRVSQTWTVTLAAGDHVVRIDVPRERLRPEPIDIRIVEGGGVTISRPGAEGSVVSWPLPASVTFRGGNPKNPWPRPRLTDTLDWFARTLHEVGGTAEAARALDGAESLPDIARTASGRWRAPEPEADAPAATRGGRGGEVTVPARPQPSPPGAAPRGSARPGGRGRSRRTA